MSAANLAGLTRTPDSLTSPPGFLEILPVAIYACDASGRILWFNRAAAELWGRSPGVRDDGELFCGSYKLYFNERLIEREDCPMAQAIRSGESVRGLEAEFERPDGSRAWVTVHIEAVRNETGDIVGAINCFHETTKIHRMNEELLRKERQLEDFFENGAVALHLVAGDGTILRANRAELDLLGYAAEEYVGRHIADFHVDQHVIEDILTRLSGGERLDKYPARLRAKDGSIKHVLITSNAQFRDGQLINTRCFTLDVTDSRLAQERLAESEERSLQLLEALPAAVYMTDAAGRIMYYNQAAVELSGRRPTIGSDEWCVSWRLYRTDGTPLPHDECPMAVALKENRPVRGTEAVLERPDGRRVPFIPYPTPLRNSCGELVGAVNMLVDISERKQSETQQRLLFDELIHRVKNNMQMLHALLWTAQQETTQADARAALADACRRIAAMSSAQRVLYSHSSVATFEATHFLETLCGNFRHIFPDDVALVCEVEQVSLANDAAMPLALILNELITNAIKYGPNGDQSTSIKITLNEEGDDIVISVEDQGPGFDFGKARRRASGLGLVMGLVRQLGGTFEVERTPHARCIVRFPRDAASQQ